MSTYTAKGNASDLEDLTLKQSGKYLYGSSRLGLITLDDPDVDGGGPSPMRYYYGAQGYERGDKEYELTNHLGNVLATVSDRRFGVTSGSSSLISYYKPHIVTAQDYYPFGMLSRVALPNSGVPYKFGFNGKMNDNEVKGLGNQQDYGMRIYDPRVGRFLSVDPITKDYPELTPYQFASNKPIWAIDLDGMEAWELTNRTNELKQEGERAINYDPIRDAIRRDIYNPQILKPDMYNVTVIGRKSNVQSSIASVKLQHDRALGEQIASGPGAAIGYLGWREKGAAVGAAFDQVSFSLAGLPGKGFSTKPSGQKWAEWVPNTEQPKVNSKTAEAIRSEPLPSPGKIINVIPEGKAANHIFSGKSGKLVDNDINRSLITGLTNNSQNLLGVDQYGKSWYARPLENGTQLYGYTQDGVVKGAGINQTPIDLTKTKSLKNSNEN